MHFSDIPMLTVGRRYDLVSDLPLESGIRGSSRGAGGGLAPFERLSTVLPIKQVSSNKQAQLQGMQCCVRMCKALLGMDADLSRIS